LIGKLHDNNVVVVVVDDDDDETNFDQQKLQLVNYVVS